MSDLEAFGSHFSTCRHRSLQLVTMLGRAFGVRKRSRLRRHLRGIDDLPFQRFPLTEKYARLVVICVTKE